MADQSQNTYADMYGKIQHTPNQTTTASRYNSWQHSQPQAWPESSYQPWHSQRHPQPARTDPWSCQPQYVSPAHDSMAHVQSAPSAPQPRYQPWWALTNVHPASTQPWSGQSRHVPSAHDSIEYHRGASSAPSWLPSEHLQHQLAPKHQYVPLYPPPPGKAYSSHLHTTSSSAHQPHTAPGHPEAVTGSQTRAAQGENSSRQEQLHKRQRIEAQSNGSERPYSSNRHDAPEGAHSDKAEGQGKSTEGARTPNQDCRKDRQSERSDGPKQRTVLIWDVDETLVLFLSLLDGSFAKAFRLQDPNVAEQLGERWQDAIMDLCDDELLFTQLEAADQTTLSSMLPYDDGMPLDNLSLPDKPVSLPLNDVSKRQMAHAYRLIKHKHGKGLAELSDSERWPKALAKLRQLVQETDAISGGWLSHARKLLHQCQVLEPGVHHVLVTTGQLIPTLAKLLISSLDACVSAGNIYSARNETKDQCFRHIKAAFGPTTKYCVIGDGPEERKCAEARDWPFIQVCLSADGQDKAAGRRLTDITAEHVLRAANQ